MNDKIATDSNEKQSNPSKKVDEMMSIMYNWSEFEIENGKPNEIVKEKEINSEDEEELIVQKISKSSKFISTFVNANKVVVPKIVHD